MTAPPLPDPPVVVAPDPDLFTLPVPAQHPWMLFNEGELPAACSGVELEGDEIVRA